jgi:hypothetical protein
MVERQRQRQRAALSPKSYSMVKRVFERTWADVGQNFAASRHEEAREVLASAVVAAAKVDSANEVSLRNAGILLMKQVYPKELRAIAATETAAADPAAASRRQSDRGITLANKRD